MNYDKEFPEQESLVMRQRQNGMVERAVFADAQKQAAGWSSVQGQQVRDKALMEKSASEAHMALEALGKQVDELLERIAPVCQPGNYKEAKAPAEAGVAKQIEAAPSPLRANFLKLKARAEAISMRISAIRCTIEV